MESFSSAALQLEQGTADDAEGLLRDMLRTAHTLKGSAGTVGLSEISQGAHRLEELLDELTRHPGACTEGGQLTDLLLRTADALGAMVTAAEEEQDAGPMLLELQELVQEASEVMSGRAGQGAPPGERRADERRGSGRRQEDPHWIKVDPARLDQLVDQGGELLIHRTRLERRVEELRTLSLELATARRQLHDALSDTRGPGHRDVRQRLTELEVDLADRATNLERGTSSLAADCEALRRTGQTLREQLGRLYLTPISLLYARLKRPLREMARDQGKRIELVIHDESSEMARSVVEQITAPLIQLLRNAVVHGIEPPAEREARGKPATGRVEISAHIAGDTVFMVVSDDGAGVDPDVLRRELRRQGRMSAEDLARLGDEDLLDTIFVSGFSTQKEADQLAGRGVGLDVVRQHISRLGGDIRVRSRPGEGTRFLIQMPMTTATAQALLFKAGDRDFGLPLAHVEQVLRPGPDQVSQQGDALELVVGTERLPLLSLARLMGLSLPPPGGVPAPPAAIVIRLGELRFAVTCTRVVGTREVVLKGLGSLLAPHPMLAAATVRSDSSVTLVLDVAYLARAAALGHQDPAAAPEPAPGGASPTGEYEVPTRQASILLADDSRSVREALGHLLRTLGHRVELAADGREAWEKLRQGPYGLMITDLEMPEVHGLELIARCRRDASLRPMPIVVLTSRSSAFSRLEALKHGAEGFLAKPVSKQVLQEQIDKLLG